MDAPDRGGCCFPPRGPCRVAYLARIVGQAASVDLLIEDLAADLEGPGVRDRPGCWRLEFRTGPVYAPAIRAAADVIDQLLDLNEFDVAILVAMPTTSRSPVTG